MAPSGSTTDSRPPGPAPRSGGGRGTKILKTAGVRLAVLALLVGSLSSRAAAEEWEAEPLVITATRIREDVALVPAAVTVIGGAELRDRGVTDLSGALALASGVDAAPGGDAGPAGSVTELWGLKEIDAFLLVVDGVPWGGALNPAISTLDLRDVERLEVIRGAAPVMYGATSFVGVIHVIHKSPSKVERSVRASYGSFGSRTLDVTAPLASSGSFSSALSAEAEKRGFSDGRTRFERDRLGWRAEDAASWGTLRLAADGTFLRQSPASPHPREGPVLSNRTPLDSNQNMADAFANEDRFSVRAGLEHDLAAGVWSTALAYGHSRQRVLRGFLTDITANPDAHGFRENIGVTDLYFDTHLQWNPAEPLKIVSGIDHLHGRGYARGGDFDYFVNLDGSAASSGGQSPSRADIQITDQRDFSGLYGFAEWEPLPAWIAEAGLRLNRTEETRRTSNRDLAAGTLAQNADVRSLWRGGGSASLTWKAWSAGRDLLNLYASWRDTFKPAAMDFGVDSQANILAPESAQSWEAGAKSRWFQDRVDLNLSVFQMDFRNVLVPTTINGGPNFTNAGATRLRGVELETSCTLAEALRLQGAYSLHDARYRDFIQTFAGTPAQLAGRRLEMSARNMTAAGLTYAPSSGLLASTRLRWTGDRALDRRNTALAKAYVTWSAGIGWKRKSWEVRLDGTNLNNRRPPVSESELGDSQYYLLPARRIDLSASFSF